MKKLLTLIGIFGFSTSLTAGSVVSCGSKPDPDPTPGPTPGPTPKPLENTVSTKGSNITSGRSATFFQQKNGGTIWSVGYGTPLQYWDADAGTWKSDPTSGLTKGSNITDGEGSTIFESSDGTLWSMGKNTSLQYWDAVEETWKSDTTSGLTKGSNITNGNGGSIFESSDGTLWSMGTGSKLQYWDASAGTWKQDRTSGLTKGSNITSGSGGCIFQSKDGTLWSMGYGKPLQYWDAANSSWENNTSDASLKTYNSNITNGFAGTIFQASDGTLWSMSNGTSLQYWDATNSSWEDSTSDASLKTYNSNITDGQYSQIFQSTNSDGTKTLWSMGKGTSLQYWDATNSSWEDSTSDASLKTYGSNITDGTGGCIFQDSSGVLWSMGYTNGPLQYWDAAAGTWKSDPTSGLTNGSNITSGIYGSIYETTNSDGTKKTLWTLSSTKKLQFWDTDKQTWKDDTA